MLDNIICSCGKNIGSLIDVYDYAWKRISEDFIRQEVPSADIDRIQWDPRWKALSGDLLDALHLKRVCCRMEMLSKVKIADVLR